jgi:cation transport regulator ChaB
MFDRPGLGQPERERPTTRRWRMPARQEEIPSTIQRSPEKVRRTYQKALDNAHRGYESEERAHRAAWAAVKHVAEKKGDHWELKERPGPSDEQAAREGEAARRGEASTHGGINATKPKAQLYEDAKRAGIRGRSEMTKKELVEALERDSRRKTARRRR